MRFMSLMDASSKSSSSSAPLMAWHAFTWLALPVLMARSCRATHAGATQNQLNLPSADSTQHHKSHTRHTHQTGHAHPCHTPAIKLTAQRCSHKGTHTCTSHKGTPPRLMAPSVR
jgi:hypothetical protein